MIKEAPAVAPRDQLIWAAVDLDSTLAHGIWTQDDPTAKIGPPIMANVLKLQPFVDAGWKIVIHTARPWHDYEQIESWLNFWKVPWSKIICGKLLAGVYIDDRAVNAASPVWFEEGMGR